MVESFVMKLNGWQGEGSPRMVRTVVNRAFLVSDGMEIGRERRYC